MKWICDECGKDDPCKLESNGPSTPHRCPYLLDDDVSWELADGTQTNATD